MLSRLLAAAFALAAAVRGLPTKRAEMPSSVHLYIQDSAGEDIAYVTQYATFYQVFFENLVREGHHLTLPAEGSFDVKIVDGTWNADQTQVDIQLFRPTDNAPVVVADEGYIIVDADSSSPATFTAKQQFNPGFFARDWWYLQNDWSVVDESEDDVRGGGLKLMTTAVEGGRRESVYLATAA